MGKHSKVSSSTKWRLGETVVLRLKECLTRSVSLDIFMDELLTSFCLFTRLGINNIRVTRVLNKNSLHNALSSGRKSCEKKFTWSLCIARIKQKINVTLTVVV